MQNIRKYIWLVPLLTLLAGPIYWELPISNPLLVDPVIVVTGAVEQGSFGKDVRDGVKLAMGKLSDSSLKPRIVTIPTPESPPFDSRIVESFRTHLMKVVAKENVVAIISGNVSDLAGPCIEIGARLRIPVFLAVATNDRLLDSNKGTSFRLVPSDNKQAATIAEWAKGQIQTNQGKPVAVFYDQSSYARDLVKTLRKTKFLGPYAVLPFELGTTTETVGLLRYAKDAGVAAWVFVGYPEQALDFLAKKRNLKIEGDVLLSDGCYGDWLRTLPIADERVFLSFPKRCSVKPTPPSTSTLVRGFGDYGHDAYWLVAKLLPHAAGRHGGKKNFAATFLAVMNDEPDELAGLRQAYQFNTRGDNDANVFDIYTVSKGEIP